jgi:hypothetical protein
MDEPPETNEPEAVHPTRLSSWGANFQTCFIAQFQIGASA